MLFFSSLLAALPLTVSCNESDDDGPDPEPTVVRSLDITVTGEKIQAPRGNIYLFHSKETDLNYAVGREADRSLMPNGEKAPLVDVSRQYHDPNATNAGMDLKKTFSFTIDENFNFSSDKNF